MEHATNHEQSNWAAFNESESIDLQYYFYLFRSQWIILVLMSLLAAAAAFGASQLITPVYRSSTTLLVDVGGATDNVDLNNIRTSELLARTYVELLESRDILEKVIIELELPLSVNALKGAISASPIGNTQLVRVQVEDTNPQRASDIANAVAQALIDDVYDDETAPYIASEQNLSERLDDFDEQIESIQAQLDSLARETGSSAVSERARLDQILSDANAARTVILREYEDIRVKKNEATSNLQQVEEAIPARSPIRPRISQNTILGLFLGLIAAAALILGRELLDDTVHDPERLSRQIGIPILGRILNFDADNERLITLHKPRAPQAENFRSVRLNLDYASPDEELRSILITSAAPSEGKSTLASNLAIVMAQGGKRTVLIDGDMRRPKVHRIFDVPNMVGLSNLFLPSANGATDSISPTAIENLFVVSSGPLPPNPSELFYSRRAGEIIQNTEKVSDMVIVDTPPIATMTDAAAIARHVDGVVLAVRFGQTKQRVLDQALEALQQVNARILGLVITDIGNKNNRYGNYYYNYRYDYSGYSVYYQEEISPKKTGLRSRLKQRKTKQKAGSG